MFHDEDSAAGAKAKHTITPGEDLSELSLEDLAERKRLLQEEILRIDAMTEKKQAGRSAADAVFKF
ncbi:DUF1192 domain-containing protein [Maricaulis parjimensis]|uniref:DUF1192 domain-containing protein n=1 Tax=Maricaulis parjimensis TaxID=144023 RepID=UPI00193948F6|nr:DUF1192 domain-containing protein [Maricaulis parjimensis]